MPSPGTLGEKSFEPLEGIAQHELKEASMTSTTGRLSVILGGALVAAALAFSAAQAAEEKEEYRPEAVRDVLLDKPLAGADGKVVNVVRFTLPPGFEGARHHHTGPVFVYVIDGALTVAVEGREPATVKAGELFEEPLGNVMQARVDSADAPTTILVFQVNDEGEPMMYRAD